MSTLLQAMATLKAVFDKYAGKEGDKNTLTKGELSDLLKKEIFVGEAVSKADVDDFFSTLDENKDGVVDFTEYVTLVAAFTMIINEK